ncbi:MAG: amino acid transporter permease, partial [Devosia sp.]|nr:amino acid transporter permease [Devosia sp.]
MQKDVLFVRSDFEPARPAPGRVGGAGAWLRRNLFATPLDSALTILGLLFLLWIVPPLYNYLIGRAVFPGGTVEQCRVENVGACWAYIGARFNFFIYGFYPIDQYWRPN